MTASERPSTPPPNPLVAAIRQVTDAGYGVTFRPTDMHPNGTILSLHGKEGRQPSAAFVTHESIDASYIPASHILARHIERLFIQITEGDSHASK